MKHEIGNGNGYEEVEGLELESSGSKEVETLHPSENVLNLNCKLY